MPALPTKAEIELGFYERFFFSQNLEPYPVQEQAFDKIFAGESVLVTVPTGTGKTMMAKAALWKALALGQTAVYTTPLRALTEEKYRELAADFGEEKVGFATGDYKVNPRAPLQVVVAEILWNRIYSHGDQRGRAPADVVVMDEGHYFNDPERGYVWEQSIIGLDPRSQLVILSATVGDAQQFCNWVYSCRKIELALVQSLERRVPLFHEYRESYLIEVVKDLFRAGDVPAIIFTFGREQCFERARLIKSCPRFTTDEERARIEELAAPVLLERGLSKEMRALLVHGIGVHHAGILPKYKQLVEKLALERLVKFVVSTETISAGLNLPARRVVFPELRKYVQKKARILTSAEYHQMAGRAGRPQFDTEGIAITLAPEAVIQEVRKEMKEAQKARRTVEEAKVKKSAYARAKSEAQRNQDVTWDFDEHAKLVAGQPAALKSQSKINASQVLAIGLPDLAVVELPAAEAVKAEAEAQRLLGEARQRKAAQAAAEALERGEPVPVLAPEVVVPEPAKDVVPKLPESSLPAYMHLDIKTVIDHLLLPDRDKWVAHKRLAQVTANLVALGVVDEHGQQVTAEMISELVGIDGLFVYFALMSREFDYPLARAMVEFLVEHDVIARILGRKGQDERRAWIKNRLRERRQNEPQVSWEDVEAEYELKFPRVLTPIEEVHAAFLARLPHPELHGGKTAKTIWADMEDAQLGFLDFVEREGIETEEGNLFSYLARVMKFSRMLKESTKMVEFGVVEDGVRRCLGQIDERVLDELG